MVELPERGFYAISFWIQLFVSHVLICMCLTGRAETENDSDDEEEEEEIDHDAGELAILNCSVCSKCSLMGLYSDH